MNTKQSLVIILLAINFLSCVQRESGGVTDAQKNAAEMLQQKINRYVIDDAASPAPVEKSAWDKYNHTKTGIYGNWVNVGLKTYVVLDSLYYKKHSIIPFVLSVDDKGAYFTYRFESRTDYLKLKSVKGNQYAYGNLLLNLENESLLTTTLGRQKISFLRSKMNRSNTVDLSAELNEKKVDYAKLRLLVRVNQEDGKSDTLMLKAAKSKVSSYILCSTTAKNFKYNIDYTYPVVSGDSFVPSVYYLNISALNNEPQSYEAQFAKEGVFLKDLATKQVKYKLLY